MMGHGCEDNACCKINIAREHSDVPLTDYMVLAVVGKRLQQDQITREGRARVDTLIAWLHYRLGDLDEGRTRVVFSGGKAHGNAATEAGEMAKYYREQIGNEPEFVPYAAKGVVKLESRATNTDENMIYILKAMPQDWTRHESTLVLFTSDYHVDRFTDGFNETNYPPSLRTAMERGLRVWFVRATEPWGGDLSPRELVLKAMYEAADGFELMRTNRDAIQQRVCKCVTATIIGKFLDSSLKVRNIVEAGEDQAPGVPQLVPALLDRLWMWYLWLETMTGKGELSEAERERFLKAAKLMYADIRELNKTVDPDRP